MGAQGMGAQGLAALEARLRQELEWLELPGKPWVPPRRAGGQEVANVAIIGGGMAGLCAAVALHLAGIDRVRVLDRAPEGREGPWITYARMETLRSPKGLAGPALGLGALTFRAWFEAQFGRTAWERLGKIPRTQWMEYLVWYRRVMGVAVENGKEVTLVRPRADGLVGLEVAGAGDVLARHVVLATGRDGLGGAFIPAMARRLARPLRTHPLRTHPLRTHPLRTHPLWAHSRDAIDFAALAGRRVAVIGAGASAMDNAATALEAGCARLDMFVRRPALPAVNKLTGIGSLGLVHGFEALPDEWKWRFLHHAAAEQVPPPRDSTLRVSRHPRAHLHLSSPLTGLEPRDGAVLLRTPKGEWTADFVIFATGFRVDLDQRPELRLIAPHIRFWRDRFAAPPGLASEELDWSPDLAPDFSFQEKTPGACPGLAQIHCFNYPSSLSHGRLTGDIPAVSQGAQRLAVALARRLFVADAAQHYASLEAFATRELLGDEWEPADE